MYHLGIRLSTIAYPWNAVPGLHFDAKLPKTLDAAWRCKDVKTGTMTLSELCQACGICCQGALFRYALLTADEVAWLSARGVSTTRRRNGALALRLGCTALQGTVCTIYDARPRACDAYFCQLAQRLRSGLVSPKDATRLVAQARSLLSEIERQLPPPVEGEPRSAVERAHQHGLRDGPDLLRETEDFLREHFLGPLQR
jgi:uncharacterized protein